jgi:hypothetical protein
MQPGAIAGAGIVIGAFFLLLGATGIVSRLARILPSTIAAGLQLGLGLSLAGLGVRIVGQLLGMAPPFLDFGLHLPQLIIPSWAQIEHQPDEHRRGRGARAKANVPGDAACAMAHQIAAEGCGEQVSETRCQSKVALRNRVYLVREKLP